MKMINVMICWLGRNEVRKILKGKNSLQREKGNEPKRKTEKKKEKIRIDTQGNR